MWYALKERKSGDRGLCQPEVFWSQYGLAEESLEGMARTGKTLDCSTTEIQVQEKESPAK